MIYAARSTRSRAAALLLCLMMSGCSAGAPPPPPPPQLVDLSASRCAEPDPDWRAEGARTTEQPKVDVSGPGGRGLSQPVTRAWIDRFDASETRKNGVILAAVDSIDRCRGVKPVPAPAKGSTVARTS